MNKKTFRKMLQSYRNLKVNQKLLFTFIILLCIPLLLLSIFSYLFSNQTLQDQVMHSVEQSFNQAQAQLTVRIQKLIQISSLIATNAQITQIVSKDAQSVSTVEQVGDMHTLDSLIYSIESSTDVSRISLYIQDDLIYAHENVHLFPLSAAALAKWYPYMKNASREIYFFPPSYNGPQADSADSACISLARDVKNSLDHNKTAVILRIDFYSTQVDEILTSASSNVGAVFWLQNKNGAAIASSASKAQKPDVAILEPDDIAQSTDRFYETVLNARHVLLHSCPIDNTDWTLVSMVPLGALSGTGNRMRILIVLASLLSISLAYVLAYYFTHSFTRRISILTRLMQTNGVKPQPIQPPYPSTDEIGLLFQNYNYQINQINDLMAKQYEIGQRAARAELMALQSQINPHFLYNTLDMIRWLSQKGNTHVVDEVIDALISFYRLSLNKGNDMVTVQDEINHVKYYTLIQKLRFPQQITLEVEEMDEAVLRIPIPKITLQPLIENAIFHGILQTPEKAGRIAIGASPASDGLSLFIANDGVSADPSRLKELLLPDSQSAVHYGLYNINQRIRLAYGPGYGLDFHAVSPRGLKVEIKLPLGDSEKIVL